MSYGLGDANDERRAEALEAQASDLERVAGTLETTQPTAAFALKTQASSMRQQADAFRKAAGLPPASTLSTGAKVGIAAGVMAVIAGSVWLLRRTN